MAAYPTVPGKKPPALNASQTTSAERARGCGEGGETPSDARAGGRVCGWGRGGGSAGAVVTGAVTRPLSAGRGRELKPRSMLRKRSLGGETGAHTVV